MKNNTIIGIVIAVVVLAGGAFAFNASQSDDSSDTAAMQNDTASEAMTADDAMMKDEASDGESTEHSGDDSMKKDDMASSGDAMMATEGSYSDYDEAKLANADKGNVVIFFHASWCPTCKNANDNFNADDAPEGLTLLKTDFDNSKDLRQKYGVTIQHTFVEVDADGNLIKKWSGSSDYSDIVSEL